MIGDGPVTELTRTIAAPAARPALGEACAGAVASERELEDADQPRERKGLRAGGRGAVRELVDAIVSPAGDGVVPEPNARVIRARAELDGRRKSVHERRDCRVGRRAVAE